VYEVYLERSAENDLKRLPTSVFHRIIPQIKSLAESPRPGAVKLPVQRTIGVLELVTIVSFTRSMRKPRP
jgi:mRNA-degrading endonuclease RelE of RelBE toxin-antitoxin system